MDDNILISFFMQTFNTSKIISDYKKIKYISKKHPTTFCKNQSTSNDNE